jgi:hypothetical protein
LRSLGGSFETVDEVVEDGVPMQVKFIFREPGGNYQLVYYRGMELCKEVASERKRKSDVELIKYK